jgi:uncharacterized protein DUF3306
MSDPEDFLSRWSRRKREASSQAEPVNPPAADEPAQDERASGKAARLNSPASAEIAFDLTSLPPIESIDAETDISGFLGPGVPSELTLAALRRAWISDPKIRNFVGLADYDWDFNAAGSMAGFGPLEIAAEVTKAAAGIAEADRTGAETPDLLDPLSTTPKAQQIAGESGGEGDRPAGVETDHEAKPSGDEGTDSSTSAPRHERMGGHEDIAPQDRAQKPDRSRSFIKRRHGGALPK